MKEIKRLLEKQFNLARIITELKTGKMSIAELQRKINMNRSTLAYYLTILESDGYITRERITEKKIGRPTLLSFNSEKYDKDRERAEKELKEEQTKVYNTISSNPLIIKILEVINKNNKVDFNSMLNNPEIANYVQKNALINWLYQNGFIKEEFSLTDKGKQFLKEKSKS